MDVCSRHAQFRAVRPWSLTGRSDRGQPSTSSPSRAAWCAAQKPGVRSLTPDHLLQALGLTCGRRGVCIYVCRRLLRRPSKLCKAVLRVCALAGAAGEYVNVAHARGHYV